MAEAKKLKFDLNPMSGEEVTKIVAQMSNLSAALKAEVRVAVGADAGAVHNGPK